MGRVLLFLHLWMLLPSPKVVPLYLLPSNCTPLWVGCEPRLPLGLLDRDHSLDMLRSGDTMDDHIISPPYEACGHSTQSMKHWKVAGAPNKPNGSVMNWYKLYGLEKAVYFSWTPQTRESASGPQLNPVL